VYFIPHQTTFQPQKVSKENFILLKIPGLGWGYFGGPPGTHKTDKCLYKAKMTGLLRNEYNILMFPMGVGVSQNQKIGGKHAAICCIPSRIGMS